VARGCERAGIPHWHPNRLRYTFASGVRREYGLEATQGYRRFGPLPATGGGTNPRDLAERIGQLQPYEVNGEWVRLRGRRAGTAPPAAFEIVNVIDRTTDLGGDRLGFVDDYFARSEFVNHEFPHLEADTPETLSALVNDARVNEHRSRGMYQLVKALALAGRARLKPLLRREVAPCFFDLYPEGRIVAIRYRESVDHAASTMRILYAGAQAPFASFRRDFPGMSMLQGWHLNSLLTPGPVLLSVADHLFYPFVGGVRGGPPGLDFVFLLDPPEQHTPSLFPRSWLALASSAPDFAQERTDFYAAIQDIHGPESQHAAHQRVRRSRGRGRRGPGRSARGRSGAGSKTGRARRTRQIRPGG
jgi:hypothetical protein